MWQFNKSYLCPFASATSIFWTNTCETWYECLLYLGINSTKLRSRRLLVLPTIYTGREIVSAFRSEVVVKCTLHPKYGVSLSPNLLSGSVCPRDFISTLNSFVFLTVKPARDCSFRNLTMYRRRVLGVLKEDQQWFTCSQRVLLFRLLGFVFRLVLTPFSLNMLT